MQFSMELSGSDLGNAPKRFNMDMSKDFLPMAVFSESQGVNGGYVINFVYFVFFGMPNVQLITSKK